MKDDYSQIYNLSQSLIRHQKAVRSIACQSTGLLASGSMDNTVCLWMKTGDNFEFLKETFYHSEYVYVVRST
jgi:WD40 repeat protein